MIDLTLEDLKQLLLDGRRARQYARDHYEELAAREAVYTLYGPFAYLTGAAIPGRQTPKHARNLSLKTRKKKYLIYELDSEYKLLRVRQVFNYVLDDTYHCFELNGIQYACPFEFNQKEGSYKEDSFKEVIALSYKEGKPYFSGILARNVVFADFFEYVSQDKVLVTEYSYNSVSEYTLHGYPTDFDAPIGALNSAADRMCWEEEPVYTDFSQWFRKAEEGSVP